jgi:hypothetical protein
MHTPKLAAWAAIAVVLLLGAARSAGATTINITATVSDRGLDVFPWDGMGANVFGNPSVVQITTPPANMQFASEERTAVEFPLGAIPVGSTIDSLILRLSPVGQNLTLGLGAGEVSEVHGYAGDGQIQVADLMDSTAVATIVGPTPNGAVMVFLLVNWLQNLVDADAAFAGLMFKGVPGPVPVVYNFDSAFSGIPIAERPTLIVDYHEGSAIPEPGTLVLIGTGLALLRRRRFRTQAASFPRGK